MAVEWDLQVWDGLQIFACPEELTIYFIDKPAGQFNECCSCGIFNSPVSQGHREFTSSTPHQSFDSHVHDRVGPDGCSYYPHCENVVDVYPHTTFTHPTDGFNVVRMTANYETDHLRLAGLHNHLTVKVFKVFEVDGKASYYPEIGYVPHIDENWRAYNFENSSYLCPAFVENIER